MLPFTSTIAHLWSDTTHVCRPALLPRHCCVRVGGGRLWRTHADVRRRARRPCSPHQRRALPVFSWKRETLGQFCQLVRAGAMTDAAFVIFGLHVCRLTFRAIGVGGPLFPVLPYERCDVKPSEWLLLRQPRPSQTAKFILRTHPFSCNSHLMLSQVLEIYDEY